MLFFCVLFLKSGFWFKFFVLDNRNIVVIMGIGCIFNLLMLKNGWIYLI